MKRTIRIVILACLSISFTAFESQALQMTFFDEDISPYTLTEQAVNRIETPNSLAEEAEFLSHLTSPQVQDFESFDVSTDVTSGLTISFGEAGNAELTGARRLVNIPESQQPYNTYYGTFPTSGDQYLLAYSTPTGSSFSIEFDNPDGIAAFGFLGTDFENADVVLSIEYLDNSTRSIILPYQNPSPTGSALFYGLIDTENPMTRITFETTSSWSEGFGFDDFVIATADQVLPGTPPVPDPVPVPAPVPEPVPEPGTLLLLGAGLLGLIGLRRRVKK